MTQPADHEARHHIRTSTGTTLFVEAGAGTGKTTALVARIVHLLATGTLDSTSQLAAITFTENAAAELRNRLRQGLQPDEDGRYAGFAYEKVEQARLARALASLDDAVLTTLHGFASRILSEAPLEAGVPPGFTAGSAFGVGREAQQSWDDFVETLLGDPAVRPHLLRALTLGFSLAGLRLVAQALNASWDRLIVRPLVFAAPPVIDAAPVLEALRRATRDVGLWPADGLSMHLRGTVLPLIAELASCENELDLLEVLQQSKLACNAGKAGDWTARGLDKKATVEALTDAEAARLAVLNSTGASATHALASRVQDWLLVEAERRKDAGTLGYHDLLVLARDVLRDDAEVRRRLRERWTVLMVDEFQDTDPLQVEIVCLLAGTSDEAPGSWDEIDVHDGRLFFVGDPKQSIYRFRRADIDLFNAVGERYADEEGRPRLQVNFRSVPGVLRAANAAFTKLFDADAGITYADLREHRVEVGEAPPVLLLGGPREGTKAEERRLEESAHLADVAVRAKGSWTVEDGRVATYKDMAVLLPTRTSLPALERALQQRGVPYRIESRSLIWSTDAVRGLVAILQALDNAADEVALLAALRHPGLACSDADLVSWKAAGGRWSLFAEVPEALDNSHPVAAGIATLLGWHEQRWWTPVNELVDTIVRELRLVELTAAERRPRDHWRRLRFLVDQARAWSDDGGSGLGDFLAWATGQMDEDADVLETVVPEPDDDAVRILTVHGSKGLEFPITMVAGLDGAGRRPPIVVWTDDGPHVRFKAGLLETSDWIAASQEDKLQNDRELTRLLYVALTRAMDHLVLGCYHCPPKGSASVRTPAQKLFDLLGVGGLARIEPARPAPSTPSRPDATQLPPLVTEREPFMATRQQLLDAVSRRVATSPTALTVAAQDPDAPEPARPDSDAPQPRRRSSRQGAAIGTATHRVLELLSTLRDPSPGEIQRLAAFACAEQQIPHLQTNIADRVRQALASPELNSALSPAARALSEVYLVVPQDERFLEGYIDLLVDDESALSVLDYKTDRARTDEEMGAKRAHYAPQLTAYAEALRVVTGLTASADLVFARPESKDEPG